jgi:hypothetical protein
MKGFMPKHSLRGPAHVRNERIAMYLRNGPVAAAMKVIPHPPESLVPDTGFKKEISLEVSWFTHPTLLVAPSDGARMAGPPGATAPASRWHDSSQRETRGGRPTGYEKNNLCVLLRTHLQRRRAVGKKMRISLGSGRYFDARDSTSSRRNRRAVP